MWTKYNTMNRKLLTCCNYTIGLGTYFFLYNLGVIVVLFFYCQLIQMQSGECLEMISMSDKYLLTSNKFWLVGLWLKCETHRKFKLRIVQFALNWHFEVDKMNQQVSMFKWTVHFVCICLLTSQAVKEIENTAWS